MLNKAERQVIKIQLDKEQKAINDLERQYKKALKDIDEKIKLLQSDELTQSRIYQLQYQKALRGQVEGILDKLQGDEYATIQQYLHDSYQDGFIGTMYSIHAQGIPLIVPLDEKAAVKAIITDSQLSDKLYNELGVNIKQLKQAVRQEITRGIASNMPFADIARNISNRSKASLGRAKTIVRTEGHRIQQASANDAREAAKERGCDVVKQWDSTLDSGTRPTHRRLDGQIRETNEPFEMDNKTAMYPGDFGKPEEDCNCRCVALTRAKWALDDEELAIMKKRAEVFGLTEKEKKQDFITFEEKYMNAAKALINQENRGIIKVGENYQSGKGFTIHQDKFDKFMLKPGSKHYQEFHAVGYRSGEAQLLALQIDEGYDESKAVDRMKNPNGSERFSIFMTLGFDGGKRFRTVWQKDTPDSIPRLITAHREG